MRWVYAIYHVYGGTRKHVENSPWICCILVQLYMHRFYRNKFKVYTAPELLVTVALVYPDQDKNVSTDSLGKKSIILQQIPSTHKPK